jgi:hypothetical protein
MRAWIVNRYLVVERVGKTFETKSGDFVALTGHRPRDPKG